MFRLLKRGLKRSHQNTTTTTTENNGSPTSVASAAAAAAAANAETKQATTTATDTTSSCFVVINNGVPATAAAAAATMGGTTSKEAAAAAHSHAQQNNDDRSITLASTETETTEEETKGSGASAGPANLSNNKNNDSDSSAEYSNYDNFGERSHLSSTNSATTTTSTAGADSAGSCSGRGSTGSRRRKRRRRRGSLKHNSSSQSNSTSTSSSISGIVNSNNNDHHHQGHNGHSMPPDRKMESSQNSGEDGDDDIEYDDDDASYSSYSSCSSSSWSDYDTLEFGRLLSLSEQKQMREQQQQQSAAGQSDAAAAAAANDTGMDCEGDGGDEAKPPMTITTNTEQTTEGAAAAKKVLGKPKRKELLEDLARTHFPDFFMDTEQNVPGAIKVGEDSASESSDDEAAVERKAVQYRTKEDQDVAVFLSLAQRMSLESLLHLLQGHVQSQREELARSYMEQYHSILRRQDTQGSSSNSLHDDLFDDNVSCSSRLVSDRSDSSLASDFDPTMVRASTKKIKPILKHPEEEEEEEDLVGEHQEDADMNKEEADAMTSDSPVEKRSEVSPGGTDEEKHRRKHRHRHHHHHHRPKPRLVKGKQFRWALVKDDQVRVVVHEVDSYKEFADDMWWNHEQMTQIRAHLIDTVKFFRKHRPMYLQSVEIVARNANMLLESATKALEDANGGGGGGNSSVPPELLALQQQNLKAQTAIVEEHMKSLMNADHAYARGLETHICKFLSEHRRSTVRAVIEEQDDCRNCHDDDDTTLHCLREQSVAYSNMSSKFSAALAKCDHIDALKASMSTWTSEVEPINQS